MIESEPPISIAKLNPPILTSNEVFGTVMVNLKESTRVFYFTVPTFAV
jgi:hypothetical protein